MNVKSKTKIMVFGTFDILHKGHINFFQQAKKIAKDPFLIVSVARSGNVKKIKGCAPHNSQKLRIMNLKRIKLIDQVVLGAEQDYLSHIYKEKPDVIALGYDQVEYTQDLQKLLKIRGIFPKIIRLKPYFPQKYKTSLIKNAIINK